MTFMNDIMFEFLSQLLLCLDESSIRYLGGYSLNADIFLIPHESRVHSVLGLVLPNPKLFVPRSECFMIVSENQIG